MTYSGESSNGVFSIDGRGCASIEKSGSFKQTGDIKYATQSGPLLLYRGSINTNFGPASPNRLRRNGIGVTRDGKVVMVMADNVTFYELSSIFRDVFHCDNAVYLDGVVSGMYLGSGEIQDLFGSFGVIIYVD